MGIAGDLWAQFEIRFGSQDYDGLLELFSDDAVYTAPAGRHEGRDGIRSWFDGWAGAFSDVRFASSLVAEQDDAVAAEWIWRARHMGH